MAKGPSCLFEVSETHESDGNAFVTQASGFEAVSIRYARIIDRARREEDAGRVMRESS